MIIFLAGLQSIPKSPYEAAVHRRGRSRGSGSATSPCPMLRPTLLFSAVIASIGLVQIFEESYVMTQGGPLNATLTVAFYAYNQFGFGNYGYTAVGQLRAVPDDRRARAVAVQAAPRTRRPEARPMTAIDCDTTGSDRRCRGATASIGLHVALGRRPRRDGMPFVWMILGSFKTRRRAAPVAAHVVPPGPDAAELPRPVRRFSTSLGTSSTRRSPRWPSPPAICCSARCSATPWRSSSFPGKRVLMAVLLSTLMVPGVRHVHAAVRDRVQRWV